MKSLSRIALLTMTVVAFGFGTAQAGDIVIVRKAPPKVRVEVKKPAPFRSAIWVRGHWVFRNGEFQWRSGRWIKPRRGFVYVPGYWQKKARGWVWVDARWRKR